MKGQLERNPRFNRETTMNRAAETVAADKPNAAGFLTQLAKDHKLTAKQQIVLRRLLSGESHKDIASALGIKATTVNTHLRRVYEKFKVHDQTHLVMVVDDLLHRWYSKEYRRG